MNIRKVYKITSENEYNICVKYLNNLNITQCGTRIVSFNELLEMYNIPDNTIYIIIKDKEFYFRETRGLDNKECSMGEKAITVEYNIYNFNTYNRREKIKKIENEKS